MGPQGGLRLDIWDNAPKLLWFERVAWFEVFWFERGSKAYGEAE
jgi:hypothetical protein